MDSLSEVPGYSESPLERSLRVQEDFERALTSHRELWLEAARAEKETYLKAFEDRKRELDAQLEVKLEERRAAKNMIVCLCFILRLLA